MEFRRFMLANQFNDSQTANILVDVSVCRSYVHLSIRYFIQMYEYDVLVLRETEPISQYYTHVLYGSNAFANIEMELTLLIKALKYEMRHLRKIKRIFKANDCGCGLSPMTHCQNSSVDKS